MEGIEITPICDDILCLVLQNAFDAGMMPVKGTEIIYICDEGTEMITTCGGTFCLILQETQEILLAEVTEKIHICDGKFSLILQIESSVNLQASNSNICNNTTRPKRTKVFGLDQRMYKWTSTNKTTDKKESSENLQMSNSNI